MPGGAIVRALGLPDNPVDAAECFYREIAPIVRRQLRVQPDVVIQFAAADHRHDDWRYAAVRQLALEAAPRRVNAMVTRHGGADAWAATLAFLRRSPGITGQILVIDAIGDESD